MSQVGAVGDGARLRGGKSAVLGTSLTLPLKTWPKKIQLGHYDDPMGHLNPNLILSVWGSISPGVKRKVTTLPSSPRLFLDCCKITDVNIQFPLPDTSSGIVII